MTALAIGMLTGIIFWFLADEMGMFFYKRNDLTWMIRLAGLCAPLLYVTGTTTSLMISIGQEAQSFRNSLFQQLLLLICLIIFTGIPSLNIYGYIVAIAISNIVLLIKICIRLIYTEAPKLLRKIITLRRYTDIVKRR